MYKKLFPLVLLLFAQGLQAEAVRYNYTGALFTAIQDDVGGHVEGEYAAGSRLTGWVLFDDFIAPSSSAFEQCCGGDTGGPTLLDFYFTDGRHEIRQDSIYGLPAPWSLETDENGDIKYWYIELQGVDELWNEVAFWTRRSPSVSWDPVDGNGGDSSQTSRCVPGPDNDYCSYPEPTYYDYASAGSPNMGEWTATVVPVPAAVWLFASALAALGLRRKLVRS